MKNSRTKDGKLMKKFSDFILVATMFSVFTSP